MDGWTFLIALVAAIPPTLVAAAAFVQALRVGRQVVSVQKDVNGRLQELLEVTGSSQRAEGVIEGAAAERGAGDETHGRR